MAMSSTLTAANGTSAGYRHEAFLYSGLTEFLAGIMAFIRRAVDAGQPILVVVSQQKIDLLRQELGARADHVRFADMASVGGNPARIIEVWRAFVRAHSGSAQVCGIGEPAHSGRSPTELEECQLHEELLNVAFDLATPFWLVCPYDLEALAAEVIDAARRAHPFLAGAGQRHASSYFRPIGAGGPFDRPLPARPAEAEYLSFDGGGMERLRAFVAQHAEAAGLHGRSVTDTVLAVHEVAVNSLRYGGGQGELRSWADDRSLTFEVSDRGHITSALVGRLRPASGTDAEVGLWLANQLCDLVQIYSSPGGTVIRICQNR
jgi:anti-sigma regulatory factor (Ser/Thr protein kinase)